MLDSLIAKTAMVSMARRINRDRITVIAYHGVPDSELFRVQLQAIARLGTFIAPADLREGMAERSLPMHSILITFDDGDPSVLHNAAPVLAERGIRPLLFVVGGLLGTTSPFWWDEVRALSPNGIAEVRRLKTIPDSERRETLKRLRESAEPVRGNQLSGDDLLRLVEAGFEIGNHTFDHPCLDQCTDSEVAQQLTDSHQALVGLGITPTAFAYPNGNLDVRAEPILTALGYDLAFLFDHRHASLDQPGLRLSRLRLDADAAPERARLIVSGLHGAIMRARRRG